MRRVQTMEYLRGAAAEPEPGSAGLSAGTPVLVTGASGLIGRQVVSVLERAGVDVYAVSRRPVSSQGHVHWITQDLTLTGAARDIVERVEPDVLFHLAGAVTGDRSLDAVHPTMTANLVATVELLEAATRAAVSRIIVSGSLLEEPADGGAAPVPPSPYGASRFASTAYARMFHAVFETPVTILRPSYAYGPGQDETKLIPYVITTALRGECMELASGERAVDFVYAADIARAYVAAATAVCVEGATIDIGSGEVTRVRDVVELLIDILGPNVACPVFGAIPVRAREQEIRVDTEPAARLLGWTATTSLNEGLEETVAWYVRRTERARTRDR